jgi:hypothetical protein
MLFKGIKKHSLLSKDKKGITIIEMLLVMSVAIPAILGWLMLQNTATKNAQIKRLGEQFAEVTHAISVRTNHDGFAYDLWQENGGRANDGQTHMAWSDTDDVVNELFRKYLVGHENPSCGEADGWNPSDVMKDDGTLEPNDSMETSSLLSCLFYNPKNSFNLDLKATLQQSDGRNKVGKFALYIDISNSKLFDPKSKDAILSIKKLVNGANRAARPKIHGLLNVYLGKIGDINDIDDDITVGEAAGNASANTTQCLRNLLAGDECTLIVELNFEGSDNYANLRTDSENSMFASIDFKNQGAASEQKCIWWQQPNKSVTELGDRNATASVTEWTAKEVDCGIHGGNDSPTYVEYILDNMYSESYLVTNEANLNHMCKVYKADTDGGFVDVTSVGDNKTPCGLLRNGDIIQLAVEHAYIGQAFVKDLIVQEIFSNSIDIVYDVNARNEIEVDLKGVNGFENFFAADTTKLINVMDETRSSIFTVDNTGYTYVHGQFEVNDVATFRDDVIMDQTLTVAETTTFQMNNGTDVVYGTNSLVFNNSADFEIYTSTGLNLNITSTSGLLNLSGDAGVNINADTGDINIENTDPTKDIHINAAGDVVLDSQGGSYSTRNMVNQTNISKTLLDGLSPDLKKDYELLNYGFGKYLDDKTGNINIRSTVAISSGNNNIVNKPDCLDFVSANPERYAGTEALTMAQVNSGYTLARLFILPLYFKTYAAALGNNQIFSQHAVHNSATEWEVYMYLSGEGIQGTGGREDAAGSGIGMIICDFNGVNFEG